MLIFGYEGLLNHVKWKIFHIYTTLAFLALIGAPYIYEISSLRVK